MEESANDGEIFQVVVIVGGIGELHLERTAKGLEEVIIADFLVRSKGNVRKCLYEPMGMRNTWLRIGYIGTLSGAIATTISEAEGKEIATLSEAQRKATGVRMYHHEPGLLSYVLQC